MKITFSLLQRISLHKVMQVTERCCFRSYEVERITSRSQDDSKDII